MIILAVLPSIEDREIVWQAESNLDEAIQQGNALRKQLQEAFGAADGEALAEDVCAKPSTFASDPRPLVQRFADVMLANRANRAVLASAVEESALAPVWRCTSKIPIALRTESNGTSRKK